MSILAIGAPTPNRSQASAHSCHARAPLVSVFGEHDLQGQRDA